MKIFLSTFAAILCAAAVIWAVWSAKTGRETSRRIVEESFAGGAQHAANLRAIWMGSETWQPDVVKPDDPFSNAPKEWADVRSARDFLDRLTATRERGWKIENSVRDYLRCWRDIVAEHGKYFPAWRDAMTKVLDQIEAEAGKK